jgi:nucleoside-diphosphate-sugar epimerase
MKVFVTGGSGYIGRPTIGALRRRGHNVTALVRGDRAAEVVAGLGATPVTGTLRDLDVLVGEDAPQSPPSLVAWRFDNEKRVLSRAVWRWRRDRRSS